MKLKDVDLIGRCVHQDARKLRPSSVRPSTRFLPSRRRDPPNLRGMDCLPSEREVLGQRRPALFLGRRSRLQQSVSWERQAWTHLQGAVRLPFGKSFGKPSIELACLSSIFTASEIHLPNSARIVCKSPEEFKACSQTLGQPFE